MTFVDLFAGLGGFHRALASMGHECVFVSEIDEELREIYVKNFPGSKTIIHGDIRLCKSKVPRHDVLCAGFPCQPFSKSGTQNGRRDRTRGTLFHEIIEILEKHQPKFVILENVGNFERHNNGRTWKIVRTSMEALGYCVRGTDHVTSGGHGLISPHHFGFPHNRERFFIVASLENLSIDPFPRGDRNRETTLNDIVERNSDLSPNDREETALTEKQRACINHWNKFVKRIPAGMEIPSFPIWGDEFNSRYPFELKTPSATPLNVLRKLISRNGSLKGLTRQDLLERLPSYAQSPELHFPDWKIAFIRQNREWLQEVRPRISSRWISELEMFPPSLRKLEWNCKGEERDLWRHVLQFRPSGLRVKRYVSSPALVAMTTTQIPVLGPKKRFLTRKEGLRLQGFSEQHQLPKSRPDAFAALGNAVHVAVIKAITRALIGKAR